MIFRNPIQDLHSCPMDASPDHSLPQRIWAATGGLVGPAAELVQAAGLMVIRSIQADRQAGRHPPAFGPTPTATDG